MCFFFFTVDNILHLQNQCAITPCDPYGVRNGLYGATKSSPKMLVCVCVCGLQFICCSEKCFKVRFQVVNFFFFFSFCKKNLY